MKLVTWNVNSLKMRLPRVLEFLAEHAPDVVCMQETKCEDAAFPTDELAAAGYQAVHHSAGRWAGVAIAARDGLALEDPVAGLPGERRDDEARWIEATAGGVRIVSTYVPNGREVGSPTFDEKLTFLDAAAARTGVLHAQDVPLAVAGDFNVAPTDLDVYDPAAFVGSTHVTPEERGRVEALLAAGGLVDAYRQLHPGAVQHTWWDYRQVISRRPSTRRRSSTPAAARSRWQIATCGSSCSSTDVPTTSSPTAGACCLRWRNAGAETRASRATSPSTEGPDLPASQSSIVRTLTTELANARSMHREEVGGLKRALAQAHGELLVLRRRYGLKASDVDTEDSTA